MKTVILAGGLGTRLAEETGLKPKPMVEIGGRPILWHIVKHFSHYGFHEIVVALGYRGDVIRRYFLEYAALRSNISIDLASGRTSMDEAAPPEPWLVHLVETGDTTNTGGRLLRLRQWVGTETFFLTYGDGVSDVDLPALLAHHRAHGALATVTAVRPPARFGSLDLDGDRVTSFAEKPSASEGWINGGYFVFEPGIFDYLTGPDDSLELDVLPRLAAADQLRAYRHPAFWQCMDTLRDVRMLESLWASGNAPWRVWS
ncbi:MAG: glucose-1-phosphate cytidylyltransferase [Chloroflexota bacterium]